MFSVDDLATELGVDPEQVLATCRSLDIMATSPRSGLSADEHRRLRAALGAPDIDVPAGSTDPVPNDPTGPDDGFFSTIGRERPAATTAPTPLARRRPNARTIIRMVIYGCLLVAIAVAVVSLRDRAEEAIEVPAVQRFTVDDIGACVDLGDGAGRPQITRVPCEDPHDAELFHVGPVVDSSADGGADVAFPGGDALATRGDAECSGRFAGYVGADAASSALSIVLLLPSPTTWALGDRSVLCLVEDPAAPLIGSVAGTGR